MKNDKFKKDGWVQIPEFPIDESKDMPKIEKKNFEDFDIDKLRKYYEQIKKQNSKD